MLVKRKARDTETIFQIVDNLPYRTRKKEGNQMTEIRNILKLFFSLL